VTDSLPTPPPLALSDAEEAVLKDLFRRQRQAMIAQDQARQQQEKTAKELDNIVGRVMGGWEAILSLRGVNPAAWQVSYRPDDEALLVTPTETAPDGSG
jgi:hypothetical protein